MRLAIILLLSSLGFAQGIGGKAGVGGKGGFGGGVAAGGGGITLDANSPQHTTPGVGTTQTIPFTIASGCTNPVLAVAIAIADSGTPVDISAISYNGTSFISPAIYDAVDAVNAPGARVAAYRQINPTHDGASHTLSVTVNGAAATGWHYSAAAFCGVNQTTPSAHNCTLGHANPATTNTCSLASVSGEVYMQSGVWGAAQPGTILDTAVTILSDTTTGTGTAYKLSLAGASTPGWTIGSGGSQALIGAFSLQQ